MKPQVYRIFVTKQMGGVNFQLQSRSGAENCCQRTHRITNTYMQAISKSNMIDQIVTKYVYSYSRGQYNVKKTPVVLLCTNIFKTVTVHHFFTVTVVHFHRFKVFIRAQFLCDLFPSNSAQILQREEQNQSTD